MEKLRAPPKLIDVQADIDKLYAAGLTGLAITEQLMYASNGKRGFPKH